MRIEHRAQLRLTAILIAAVFVSAQSGALAHAYQHDPSGAQVQACATCLAGQSLGSACVESVTDIDIDAYVFGMRTEPSPVLDTIDLPVARQRSPPTLFR